MRRLLPILIGLLLASAAPAPASSYVIGSCSGTTTIDGVSFYNAQAIGSYAVYTSSTGAPVSYYASGLILVAGVVKGVTIIHQARIKQILISGVGHISFSGDTTLDGKPVTMRIEFFKPTAAYPKGRVGWYFTWLGGSNYPTGKNADGTLHYLAFVVNTGYSVNGPYSFVQSKLFQAK